MEIEDIILANDRRGISALRPHLPPRFCQEAAQFILDRPGPAFIITGFYILAAGKPETDGPPGAVAIGQALQALRRPVWYITDRYAVSLLKPQEKRGARVVEFPIAGVEESRQEATRLLQWGNPSVLIAIERPGLTKAGQYKNMRGLDITQYTARVDHLFLAHNATVGIGDGGNEVGMGVLYNEVLKVPSLVKDPTATRVSRLVIASVSNWGGYGLVAALSRLVKRDLLPQEKEHGDLIRWMVDQGAVDGISARQEPAVDGFPLEEELAVIRRLRQGLREK